MIYALQNPVGYNKRGALIDTIVIVLLFFHQDNSSRRQSLALSAIWWRTNSGFLRSVIFVVVAAPGAPTLLQGQRFF